MPSPAACLTSVPVAVPLRRSRYRAVALAIPTLNDLITMQPKAALHPLRAQMCSASTAREEAIAQRRALS